MSTLLEVKNLKKYFSVPSGTVHAVDNVTFKIDKGTTLGVVGESGCGKSTLGRTIVHLLEPTDGQIFLEGNDITNISKKELRKLREEMQFIFQDPFSSLNPRMSIRESIIEPLVNSKRFSKAEMNNQAADLMNVVGLSDRFANSYPHELDGGRRQRVVIARAMAMNPKFVVCDEPVSALDVSIQAQILNLMMDLQEERNLTYIFITHDLSVVKHISQDICVMYLGEVVENCTSDQLFAQPKHPYTKALLSAIPVPDVHSTKKPVLLKGEITSPVNPIPGCRFAQRCPYRDEACSQPQKLVDISNGRKRQIADPVK